MRIVEKNRRGGEPGRRGFTLMLVIGVMVLMGGAVVGLSTTLARDVRRTRSAVAAVQLRQLLLAGVPAAKMELAVHGDMARDVAIETPVEGAALTLHITPGEAGAVDVRARAEYGGFRASQMVHFSHGVGSDWTVRDVRLDQTQGQ